MTRYLPAWQIGPMIEATVERAARNRVKTKCLYGHPLDAENTRLYVDKYGGQHRYCRECTRRRNAKAVGPLSELARLRAIADYTREPDDIAAYRAERLRRYLARPPLRARCPRGHDWLVDGYVWQGPTGLIVRVCRACQRGQPKQPSAFEHHDLGPN